MKLIVGLGNPGRNFAQNRHNIGFRCLNHFARAQGIRFDRKQGKARIGVGEIAGSEVILAKPQTYMNLSGESVSRLVKRFDINLNDLIVIHDDLDLPLGKIRFHRGGGWTTHKGVGSVIAELGSGDYSLLRVGIGRPPTTQGSTKPGEAEIIDFVLSNFTADEWATIKEVIPRVSDAIYCLLTEGLTTAMNRYN